MRPEAVHANPFPGLRPFKVEEEHLFFGRESQVDAMVDKLAATRFLSVVGTSGSGKSSLVNCGLRPALQRGLMAHAGTDWRIVQFRPGSTPIKAMARALAAADALLPSYETGIPFQEIVETTLRVSKLGLVDIYRKARLHERKARLDEDFNLLVVVDQFEELFRYRALSNGSLEAAYGVGEEATAFVNLLMEAKEQADYPVYVAITMRSDFLGECAQFAGLPAAINEGQYLVPRMTRDERRAAIAGPTAVGEATMTPVLLMRLVNDVGANPDQLSILQHALNRTWARWQQVKAVFEQARAYTSDERTAFLDQACDGDDDLHREVLLLLAFYDDPDLPEKPLSLDLPHYRAIGTMAFALDRHAEEAFDELDTERKKKICEKIFKALTDKATYAQGVRRPTKLGTLCALAGATQEEVVEVIDVFRKPSRSFLMPPISVDADTVISVDADTVIDISHESLMRVWKQLIRWVDEETESARKYRRLAETGVLYYAKERRAGLWRDPDLQLALDWCEDNQPTKAWAARYHAGFRKAMAFLERSRIENERAIQEEKDRREFELKQARDLAKAEHQRAEEQRKRFFAAIVFGLIAVILAAIAFTFWSISKVERDNAVEARQQALAARDSTARALATSDSLLGITQQARASTARALATSDSLLGITQEARDSTARALATSDSLLGITQEARDSTRQALAVADTARKQTLGISLASRARRQQDANRDTLGALLAREAYVFNDSSGGDFQNEVFDALRQALITLVDPDNPDTLTSKILHEHDQDDAVRSVAYSPDGDWVVSAGGDGMLRMSNRIADTDTVLKGHRDIVRALAFRPDGKRMVSVSDDQTLRLWDVEAGTELQNRELHRSGWAVAYSSRYVVTAGTGNTLLIWDVSTDTSSSVSSVELPDSSSYLQVKALAFSHDGQRLAVGTNNGLWLGDPMIPQWTSPPLQKGHVETVAFSPDDSLIASGGKDTFVRVWRMDRLDAPPEALRGHRGPVEAVAFSPDGKMLATGSSDRVVRLWRVDQLGMGPTILEGHKDWVHSVSFSPDSYWLVSGSADRTVRVWNVNAALLANEICKRVGRAITRKDWITFVGRDIPYSYHKACPSQKPINERNDG